MKASHKAIIILAIFFLIIPFSSFARGFTSSEIDELVHQSMEMMPDQAGLAVAVIEDGKIIHSKGYGTLSVESTQKVDEHTLFQIASNTKSFTAAALAILVDQGKLNWNDKVIKHIPEFTMYNDYVRENFTIIDLLTHRSGLGLGAGDLMFYPPGSDFTINDVLSSFQYFKPVSDFRTKYDYDNSLYLVAGEIISRVSKQSYDEFLQQNIFDPLQMDRTTAAFKGIKSKTNIADAHITEKGQLKKIPRYSKGEGALAASGGIYSSIHDMSQWFLLQLNQGKYGPELKQQIFSPNRQAEMWKPYTVIGFEPRPRPAYKWHFGGYGLGWFISHIHDYSIISHTGELPGMLSSMIIIPEINSAVIVLTNSSPGGDSYNTISSAIRDEWIGRNRWDYLTNTKEQLGWRIDAEERALKEVWDKAKISSVTKLKAQEYLGTYQDKWFGNISIENRSGKLWLQSERSPQLNGEMFQYEEDVFAVKMSYTDMPSDAFVTFERNEQGIPFEIKMKGISPYIDFSFDYQDLELIKVSP
ncbi:MAG: serine hydrolase [Kangiellaceae bacterium]|nr:serine hydrolase [Kangiellaceae bacterium]